MEDTLFAAAEKGNLNAVRRLVRQGVNINATDDTFLDYSALHWASRNGHGDVVRVLLQDGANVNSVTISKETPLHVACSNGHERVAQILLQNGANANSVADYEWTPLHYACSNGDVQVVQLLLQNGTSVNVAQALLNRGLRTHGINKEGRTPLGQANFYGYNEVVNLLLKHIHQPAQSLVGNPSLPMIQEPFGGGSGNQEADLSSALLAAAQACIAADGSNDPLRENDVGENVTPSSPQLARQSLDASNSRKNLQQQQPLSQQQKQPGMAALNKPAVPAHIIRVKTDWNSKNYRDGHPLRRKDELDDKELLRHCKSFLTHLSKQRCKQPAGSSQRVNDCHCLKVCLVSKAKKPRALLDTASFMVAYGRMRKDEQNRHVIPQIAKAMMMGSKNKKHLTGLCFPLPNHANFGKASSKKPRASNRSYPQTVCKSAFLRILGIADTRFRNLKKHAENGTLPVHGLRRKYLESRGKAAAETS